MDRAWIWAPSYCRAGRTLGPRAAPHSVRRSAEENNATARSSGLGPSRPARLPAGPASGPPPGRHS